MNPRARWAAIAGACVAAVSFGRGAQGIELPDVLPAAMDQPQINAIVFVGDNALPQVGQGLVFDPNDPLNFTFGSTFNIQAYLDTGASGILLSGSTGTQLSIPTQTVNGQSILYYDVGVAGSDQFQISQPIRIALANYYPRSDIDSFTDTNNTIPNIAPYTLIPIPSGQNLRAQVGPVDLSVANPVTDDFSDLFNSLSALEVVGMPAMKGKVMVMDATRVNVAGSIFNGTLDLNNLDDLPDFSMRTYLYNPGTPYHDNTKDTDPGIPTTQLHVKLSFASFDKFTQVTPGGTGPTLAHNPFIGKDPVALAAGTLPAADANVPGIKITHKTSDGIIHSSEGNWLLDTGAAASIISLAQAATLGIHYLPGTEPGNTGSLDPVLLDESGQPLTEQFSLGIGGIGGQENVGGFYLDSLLVRTMEGNAADDNDPLHLKFLHAPVLVSNISVRDPSTDQVLTLDGIFGMNYLVASASISSGDIIPTFDAFSTGYFNWITFDETAGVLGLSFDPASGVSVNVPEPASITLLGAGALLLVGRRRARK